MSKSVRVKTGVVRIAYANLFEAKVDLSGKPRFGACLIIKKTDKETIDAFKAAANELAQDPETQQKWGHTTNGVRNPLRDGDTEKPEDPAFKGAYFLNAHSNADYPPALFQSNGARLVDKASLYSGCYCQIILNLYAYAKGANKGIGASIGGVMKVNDGEPLSGSGGVTASMFDDFSGQAEDAAPLDTIF